MPCHSKLSASSLLFVLAALLLLISPAASAPSPGNYNKPDCKTVKSGQSIQQAIKNSRPGTKITVEKGVYEEQLEITTDGIQLIGKGAILSPPKKIVKNFCTGLAKTLEGVDGDAGICIHSKGVKLGPYQPFDHRKFVSTTDYVKNVVVTGFTVKGFTGQNIAVIAGQNVKVTKNSLQDGNQYGFLTVGSKNTLASENVVTAVDPFRYIALCMDDQSSAEFSYNDISNHFIALCTQTSYGVVKKNKVRNCCVGPFVDPNVKGAKILENTITDRNPSCPPESGAGVVLFGAQNTLVEKNVIKRINNNGNGAGIFLGDDDEGPAATGALASGNIVRKNVLRENDYDIVNLAKSTNTISNNQCVNEKAVPGPNYCS